LQQVDDMAITWQLAKVLSNSFYFVTDTAAN
jgi:hypothetical protein